MPTNMTSIQSSLHGQTANLLIEEEMIYEVILKYDTNSVRSEADSGLEIKGRWLGGGLDKGE